MGEKGYWTEFYIVNILWNTQWNVVTFHAISWLWMQCWKLFLFNKYFEQMKPWQRKMLFIALVNRNMILLYA